jgi:IS4 transposase
MRKAVFQARRDRVNGTLVRVIEYSFDGIPDPEPSYRLVTNWLDIDAAPAVELAARYRRRWTIEQSFDELKVHLAARDVLPRSKRPALLEQEFYALLLAHAAIRRLMSQAAVTTDQAAEDLSFVHAVRVLKRRLPASAALSP